MAANIEQLLKESRSFEPQSEFKNKALISSMQEYETLYQESIDSPDTFWPKIADDLHWFSRWDRVCDWSNAPHAKWFEGGTTNIAYNCLDHQIALGRGSKNAIVWQGEPQEDQVTLTYDDLHKDVCRASNMLKNLGVQKGDRVVLYMPMIPELAIAVLACARIGAVHSVIFGGFSAQSIVDRIEDAQATFVITADGGYRRGKVLPLKNIVDEALLKTEMIKRVVVVQRTEESIDMKDGRDVWWHESIESQSNQCAAAEQDSEDPLFILYTSGSTGKPKGILHSTAGYMVGTYLTSQYIFDLKEDDVYWCTADIGWITGHSYIIYGPMLNGATVMMYEGAPNHPEPDRFWKIVDDNKVTVFYTAPTAIRAFMKWGDEWPEKYDLSSLRLLGTVGEPINPEAWMWYHERIGKEKCPIVDTWWQTETGAIMLSPIPGVWSTKPGSATRPFFGVDADIVDEQGNSLPANQGGLLVLKKPWPSMLRNIYRDEDKFEETYWSKFKEQGWYFAGDGAFKDEDGYFWVMGRIDDVLNVSGHRLSTMEVESALVSHDLVVEAAVVGFPHEIKGDGIAAFVISKKENTTKEDEDELRKHVAKEIGALAKPDQIRFTAALPKTRSGKIMRRLLRDIAAGREIVSDTSTLEDMAVVTSLKG